MTITWYAGYGGYNNTGPYNNVLLVGSPTNSLPGLTNVNLTAARAEGYAQGIGFESEDGSTTVNVHVNLAGVSVTDQGQLLYNQKYVPWGGRYEYYVKLSYSTDGGNTYIQYYLNKDVSHSDTGSLLYTSGWQTQTFKRTYTVNLPENFTHLKFEIYGEDATFPYANIFTRKQVIVITDIKPWAIRKSGVFKTLNVPSGKFQIRKGGAWIDKSLTPITSVDVINQGTSRVRKSGNWRGQNKFGS